MYTHLTLLGEQPGGGARLRLRAAAEYAACLGNKDRPKKPWAVRFLRKAFAGITALTLGEKLGVVANIHRGMLTLMGSDGLHSRLPALSPHAELRHLEGQRSVVGHLLQLIERGRAEAAPLPPPLSCSKDPP